MLHPWVIRFGAASLIGSGGDNSFFQMQKRITSKNYSALCIKTISFRILSTIIILIGIVYSGFDYMAERSAHMGLQFLKTGQPAVTIKKVSKLAKIMPWRGRLWHLWGTSLVQMKNYDAAREKLEHAMKYRFNYMINIHYGILLETMNELDAAEKQFDHVLDYASSFDAAEKGKIRILSKKRLLSLAKSPNQIESTQLIEWKNEIKPFLNKSEIGPFLDFVYAELLYRLNAQDEFIEYYRKKGTESSKKWHLLFELRDAYLNNEFDEAMDIADQIIAPPKPHFNVLVQTFEVLKAKSPNTLELKNRYKEIINSLKIMGRPG